MDPIVMAAGTALVSTMTTSAWVEARDGVVALWRRVHPERAEQVGADLEAVRADVLEARQTGDHAAEEALAGTWRTEHCNGWSARTRRWRPTYGCWTSGSSRHFPGRSGIGSGSW